jgi:hypothetical protein
MTYVGMSEGQDAGIAWESLVRGGLDQAEREKTERRFWIIAGRTRWRWSSSQRSCINEHAARRSRHVGFH